MALAALLLAGCGQSGPLYLPDNPPESQKPRAQRSAPAVPPAAGASGAAPAPAAP